MIAVEFVLYLLIYMLLPGLMLEQMLGVAPKKKVMQVLFAFFGGMGMLILEYIFFARIGFIKGVTFVNPIFVAIILVVYRKQILPYLKEFCSGCSKYNIIAFVGMFFTMAILSYVHTQSTLNMANDLVYNVHPDTLYCIAMAGELSQRFPIRHFIWAGVDFPYHFFQHLLFGIFEIISGNSVISAYHGAYALMCGFVSAVGLTSLVDFDKKRVWYINLIMLFLPFIGGFSCREFLRNGGYVSGILNEFIFNMAGEGTATVGLIAAFLLYSYCIKEKNIKNYILLFLVTFAASGVKSTVLLIFTLACIGTVVVKTIGEKKFDKWNTLASAVVTVAYAIVFIFITSGLNKSGTKQGLRIDFRATYAASGVCTMLKNIGFHGVMHYIGYPILAMAVVGPLVFIAIPVFFKECKVLIKYRKVSCTELYISLAMLLTGSGMFIYTFQRSSSHRHFILPVVVGMVWIVNYLIREGEFERRLWYKIVFAVSIIFGLFIGGNECVGFVKNDVNRIRQVPKTEVYNSISAGEIEGCEWLRDNTEKDAVIAIDRICYDDSTDPNGVSARYYYYNAYAERQTFIAGPFYSEPDENVVTERYNINCSIYQSSGKKLDELLVSNGIDYVIVTTWLGTEFNPDDANVSKVFDNGAMMIYKNNN